MYVCQCTDRSMLCMTTCYNALQDQVFAQITFLAQIIQKDIFAEILWDFHPLTLEFFNINICILSYQLICSSSEPEERSKQQ